MRINAIIASAILAATVSGAALPLPAAAAVPATIGQREAKAEAGSMATWRPYGLPIGGKREAAPEAEAEAGAPKRPYGLPIGGKREAAPVAAWKPPKRPYGLPVGGKREAAPEADAPWRPYGLPIGGKHEADEE